VKDQAPTQPRTRAGDWLLPAVLGAIAGSVDVIGFLALGGLFTAHITGNLVILAAHYVTGSFSQIGPLLSVPVFVAVLGIVSVLFSDKTTRGTRRLLLIVQAVLLAGFLTLGTALGPFASPDSGIAVFAGMLGVAAMATQNALVKLGLPGHPSTAVVTTNTTQLATDLALLAHGRGEPDSLAGARLRIRKTFPPVAGFVAGCAAAAVLEVHFGLWALALPTVLAAGSVPLGELERG
jgi:uncharacterized membrane protein YoaK (UPF0700 family)